MELQVGAGPLGRTVEFGEFGSALKLSTPQIVASGSGSTTIVGNGTAQTVFTDSFTAGVEGDIFEIVVRYRMSNTVGADTPDFVLKLGSTNLNTSTLTSGAGDAFRMFRAIYSYSATGSQGWGFVESIAPNSTTGTAGQNIVKQDGDAGWANTVDGITLTCDSATGTTTSVRYTYSVIKTKSGV